MFMKKKFILGVLYLCVATAQGHILEIDTDRALLTYGELAKATDDRAVRMSAGGAEGVAGLVPDTVSDLAGRSGERVLLAAGSDWDYGDKALQP